MDGISVYTHIHQLNKGINNMNNSNSFTTELDCEFLGELTATVHFDYLPAEPEVLYPTDDAHPGCAEEADITNVIVKLNGMFQSIMALVPEHLVDELAERAIEWLNDQSDEGAASDHEQSRLEEEYGI
jgi:hypothetical protein